MDDETTGPADGRPPATYERLCRELYNYQFGRISFLELLDAFEEILHIEPPRTVTQEQSVS